MKKRIRQLNVFSKDNAQFYNKWYNAYGSDGDTCSNSLKFNEDCNSQYIALL